MTDLSKVEKINKVIAEALKNHREIYINGLGTFSVEHQKQDHRQVKDGRVLLYPPADNVKFEAEN